MAARNPLIARQRGGTGGVVTVPAPLGGLNTRDPKDAMPATDATRLVNWVVTRGQVRVRRGYSALTTAGAGDVETLAEYLSGGTRVLVAGGDGKLYDATANPATELAAGFTNDRWSWTMFDTKMGLVNGADTPQQFDGTTVSALTCTGTGLTPAALVGVFGFKGRSYFWAADSQDFWYSALDTLGGALTRFPLSRVGSFGGSLLLMTSLQVDSGSGPDDFAVFVMTSGDAIVYAGSDPASNFSIVGRFRIGEPAGRDAVTRWGGDVYVMTRNGVVSLRAAMAGEAPSASISAKIDPTLATAITAAAGLAGAQLLVHPADDLLIVSLPRDAMTAEQYAMSLTTGAWGGPWQSLPSRCLGLYNGDVVLGGAAGAVYRMDADADAGAEISADAITAYNLIGQRGQVKSAAAFRPILTANGNVTGAIVALFDYALVEAVPDSSVLVAADTFDTITSEFGAAEWTFDSQPTTVAGRWRTARGAGYAGAIRLVVETDGSLVWETTAIQGMEGPGWR